MTALRTLILSVALGLSLKAHALNQTVVTISGNIYASVPCVINNNRPISAPFGDVQTNAIDGTYKTVTLEYNLTCDYSRSNELRMKVLGTAAGFDNKSLAVPNHQNLGVAMKVNGARMAINTWFNFDVRKPPALQAVLVKLNNSELKFGSFRAGATLVVDYR